MLGDPYAKAIGILLNVADMSQILSLLKGGGPKLSLEEIRR